MLGSSAAIGNISRDTRVTSGDYFGQLTEADPYVSLKNIAGFTEVREFPSFPTNNNVMGTFTATGSSATLTCTPSAIAQAIEPLSTGDRVQVSNVGGALPTGLSANTDYFVVNPVATIGSPVPSLTNYTFQLSATLGGSAISPSAAGTGVNTVTLLENLNAFAFEKRAIHIAVRQMMDALDIAKGLGIPVPVAYHTETDAVTGLTFSSFMWINTDTHDIYVAIVVMYGIETGRGLKGSADPGSLAAGTALDYAGLRIPETATNV